MAPDPLFGYSYWGSWISVRLRDVQGFGSPIFFRRISPFPEPSWTDGIFLNVDGSHDQHNFPLAQAHCAFRKLPCALVSAFIACLLAINGKDCSRTSATPFISTFPTTKAACAPALAIFKLSYITSTAQDQKQAPSNGRTTAIEF